MTIFTYGDMVVYWECGDIYPDYYGKCGDGKISSIEREYYVVDSTYLLEG